MRSISLLILLLASVSPSAAQRVVHVVVALCDNVNQGIVKVPESLGNGQNAKTNLYWGAAYGVRTHFDRSAEWIRQPADEPADAHILERAVWKHRDSAVYLVADAYDGRFIREATESVLRYASGGGHELIQAGGRTVLAGGGADLVAYIGHDGLMDFDIDDAYPALDHRRRDAIILACISKRYYAGHLQRTGATPLLWTTGLMAPEAYTLKAALDGWILREDTAGIRERAAGAYDHYQKCGMTAARRLLVSGW